MHALYSFMLRSYESKVFISAVFSCPFSHLSLQPRTVISGLCFLAFAEAFVTLATKKFGLDKRESTIRLTNLWHEQKIADLARQKRSKQLPLLQRAQSKHKQRSLSTTNASSVERTAPKLCSRSRHSCNYDFRNQKHLDS